MKEVKELAKNTGLLAIGQFGTKLLSFFLVPLYTYVLSTADYGTYDLMNTTVSLLVPILSLNICDSALRFPLDKNVDRKQVFSICANILFNFPDYTAVVDLTTGAGLTVGAGEVVCATLFSSSRTT